MKKLLLTAALGGALVSTATLSTAAFAQRGGMTGMGGTGGMSGMGGMPGSMQGAMQGGMPSSMQGGGGQMGQPREITRQEAQQFADAMFQRFDLNHDGIVTRDEAEQVRAQMAQGGDGNDTGRGEKMVDRVFGTSQSLTEPQFEAQALARFDSQDANHDGVVTPDERHRNR